MAAGEVLRSAPVQWALWTVLLITVIAIAWLVNLRLHGKLGPPAPTHPQLEAPDYLDQEEIEKIFSFGRYTEKAKRTFGGSFKFSGPGFEITVGGQVDEKESNDSAKPVKAAEFIGIILRVLRKAGDLVYVDLDQQTLESGPALIKAFRAARLPKVRSRTEAHLSDLTGYVLVEGDFQSSTTNEGTTLSASYPGMKVHVSFAGSFTKAVPRTFRARCFGRLGDPAG